LPRPYTWQNTPVRAGRRVRAQPWADIHAQHDLAVGRPGQRQHGQRPPEPGDVDPAAVQPVVQGAVPAPVLGRQRQPDQGLDRPVGAQHRVGQLEQRIRPRGQTSIQLAAEQQEILNSRRAGRFAGHRFVRHTAGHGHRLVFESLW
jgi:hypothetical protein